MTIKKTKSNTLIAASACPTCTATTHLKIKKVIFQNTKQRKKEKREEKSNVLNFTFSKPHTHGIHLQVLVQLF